MGLFDRFRNKKQADNEEPPKAATGGSPPEIPMQGTITEWNSLDRVGTIETVDGTQFRFGASACHFEPEQGLDCWVLESLPGRGGRGLRAKAVNRDGTQQSSPGQVARERIIQEKSESAEAERIEAERILAAKAKPREHFYSAIEELTGFSIPRLYRRILEENAIEFMPEEWLEPYEILDALEYSNENSFDPGWLAEQPAVSRDEVQRGWIHEIPFAMNGGGEWICWRKDLESGDATPVFLCDKVGEREGVAPHLEGFIYRDLLENFCGVPAQSEDEFRRAFMDAVDQIRPFLRTEWTTKLDKLAQQTPKSERPDGANQTLYTFLDQDEVAALISKDLAFDLLDKILE